MGFRSLLALVLVAGLVHVPTTQAGAQKIPVLGYMANESVNPERLAIFKKGLVGLGYVEGKTIAFEYRAGKLDNDYPGLVAELIDRHVDIIVASNAPAAVAASRATRTIPIVIAAVNDPVGLGLVHRFDEIDHMSGIHFF
jgi:putative tryptophan/tyrosine transport system substrate-binding protein